MKEKEIRTEIAIVGGGVTGLVLLKKLSELGYETALIEKEDTVGNGPSANNEGILHMGTRHSVSTKDIDKAKKIVNRCQYGGEQFLQYAPESLSDPELKTFAAITHDQDIDAIVKRWNETGVGYKEISLGNFSRLVPEADLSRINRVFETRDVPINVRILYQKLINDAQRAGGQLFVNSRFTAESDTTGIVTNRNGEKTSVKADLFIVTTGYAIREIFNQVTGQELPVRFWKSHMVVTPRLAKHALMYIKNGEANTTHQGKTSIGGQWEDASVVEVPDLKEDRERVIPVFDALTRAFPGASKYKNQFLTITCIKPDVAKFASMARSVDIEVFEPEDSNYIFALPGKMTESPYVADAITRLVFHRNSDSLVSLRPSDIFELNQGENHED